MTGAFTGALTGPRRWSRNLRRVLSRLPHFAARPPEAPALPVRDPWPGDASRGARLLRDELEIAGTTRPLAPTFLKNGRWADPAGRPSPSPAMAEAAHGFTWLRDLRALGTDAARTRARLLVADWIATPRHDRLAYRPDIAGARLAAWLGHYDFFAASADDAFRQRLMACLVAEARRLAASLPADEIDARSLTALKGLIAAAVALPGHAPHLGRALRLLPHDITRQILPDGCHAERSPAAQLAALQDLTEIRALLQAADAPAPAALGMAIDRMAPALRALRHGDGGLVLFNGTQEASATLIELVLTQAGRGGRAPAGLTEGGFHRMQAGRSMLIVDGGAPPAPGLDRRSHAGTLSFELSIGRERLIVNCGAVPLADAAWRDAARMTAAHSTLVIADTNSSELRPHGLGRHPARVEIQRHEANGAHWLEASHDGYAAPYGALHRRRLYIAESGEDIRGEDALESETPRAFTVRFHLHPAVAATLQPDGETVLLRLTSGSLWCFKASGSRVTLEESIYLGSPAPRPCTQIVFDHPADGPQHTKWTLTKLA